MKRESYSVALSISAIVFMVCAQPLSAGKVEAIVCAITNCLGGGPNPAPPNAPPEAPDPPSPIGFDPAFALPSAPEEGLPAATPFDPDAHAFSMIGDSRTHFAYGGFPVPNDLTHWEQHKLLGKWRTGCSGKRADGRDRIGIHNAAVGGTTAEDWTARVIPALNNLSSRVVAMVGGNDLWRKKSQYETYTLYPIAGQQIRLQVTSAIHKDVKKVVTTLVASGREVIYQRYFYTNPSEGDWRFDAGIDDLNAFAYQDFGPEVITVRPAMPYISGWRSKCSVFAVLGWCPFCLKNVKLCITVPEWKWTKPEVRVNPTLPGVSFAQIRKSMPSSWFFGGSDLVHLNNFGYQAHANDLHWALSDRCWW